MLWRPIQKCDNVYNIIVKAPILALLKALGGCGDCVCVCYICTPHQASRSFWIESLGGPMQCVRARLCDGRAQTKGVEYVIPITMHRQWVCSEKVVYMPRGCSGSKVSPDVSQLSCMHLVYFAMTSTTNYNTSLSSIALPLICFATQCCFAIGWSNLNYKYKIGCWLNYKASAWVTE